MVIAWAWVTCVVLVHAVTFVGMKHEQSKHPRLSFRFQTPRAVLTFSWHTDCVLAPTSGQTHQKLDLCPNI